MVSIEQPIRWFVEEICMFRCPHRPLFRVHLEAARCVSHDWPGSTLFDRSTTHLTAGTAYSWLAVATASPTLAWLATVSMS